MNVLYLHTHDSGRYIEPYGHAVATPALMRLAQEGTLFRNAFCAAPTCSPSRAALLTGTTAHESGMVGLAHRGFRLSHPERHLTAYLRAQGYATALCGLQHEFSEEEELPYEFRSNGATFRPGIDHDRAAAEAAIAYLRQCRRGEPFFLSLGLHSMHRDFPSLDGTIDASYVLPPAPLPDHPEIRRDMAAYLVMARIADTCIGEVLAVLDQQGLANDTLVFFTTDHGLPFPFMKCSLYDAGIGVAFILKYPGNPHAGRASDALVSHLDVFPTLCDLLQLPRPPWLSGRSLRPVLEGSTAQVRNTVFAEVNYHASYEPVRCVRTSRFKLIRHFEATTGIVGANVDASPTKRLLVKHGLWAYPRAAVELFDLWFDPGERCNLASSSTHREIFCKLQRRMDRWMRETNDPLRSGPVPPPEGARIDPRDAREASLSAPSGVA